MQQDIPTFARRHEQGVGRALPKQSRNDGVRVENEPHARASATGTPALGPISLNLCVDLFH
jgi:hypothetical protein